uniref:Uncharacterized protein n=1 Tax=Meiothermus ruber TaxID=277 RepID=A0A7C3DR00_MEIRU
MNKTAIQPTAPAQNLYCTNADCKWDVLNVEEVAPRVWLLREPSGMVYQLAAHQPICPRCTSPLQPLDEIKTLFPETITETSR